MSDPRARLAAGAAGLAVTALAAGRRDVGVREDRAFRAVNQLPDSLYVPAWVVMQLGNLGAAPAAAGAAYAAGKRSLAWPLLLGGSASWALSKVVKRGVGRPRPAVLLAGTRRRGREQAGLGYLSGHAAVAVALGAAALPRVGQRARVAIGLAMPAVALCRVYVGAHLPLDVLGGASLGLVVEATTVLVLRRRTAARNKRRIRSGAFTLSPLQQPLVRSSAAGPSRAWEARSDGQA